MPFAFSARTYVFVAILPALSLAAACTTMRLEDTVPAAAAAPVEAAAAAPQEPATVSYARDDPAVSPPPRPTTRGGFPNLNIRPETASEQLTASERLQKSRELETARQRAAEEAPTRPRAARTAAEIQRDARQREEETLRRIEGR